jgi:hypothetical protein
MARYLTQCFVAVTWTEAVRLAYLDGTPLRNIRVAAEVELVHRTEWWAWWSDERLTTAIALPEILQPIGLSADAVLLIDQVWCSRTAVPRCGWRVLANVQRLLGRETLAIAPRMSDFRSSTWERLTVEFLDGQRGVLYRFWQGGEDEYLCQIDSEPPVNFD